MSTRSNIAIENLDGTVRAIYCHHDGYPEGVGATLATYYRTEEQIEELLALGNLSALEQTPVECDAYGSDDEIATTYENRAAFAKMSEDSDLEYLYLNVCGVWLVFDVWHDKRWKRLSDVIEIAEPENDGVVVTAEQITRSRQQYNVYSTYLYAFNELQRRAAALVEALNEFDPVYRVRNLAPIIDAELDARAYMNAFESCDGWNDGNYRAPHPILFQALPTFDDVIGNCVDLYADYAWDAYSEDRTDDPIDIGLYIDDDGDAQIDDNCELFTGYVCSITLTGLTKYDSQRDDETRDEFLAAARPVIRDWIEDRVRDAWDNVLELQNYRYPENVPEV